MGVGVRGREGRSGTNRARLRPNGRSGPHRLWQAVPAGLRRLASRTLPTGGRFGPPSTDCSAGRRIYLTSTAARPCTTSLSAPPTRVAASTPPAPSTAGAGAPQYPGRRPRGPGPRSLRRERHDRARGFAPGRLRPGCRPVALVRAPHPGEDGFGRRVAGTALRRFRRAVPGRPDLSPALARDHSVAPVRDFLRVSTLLAASDVSRRRRNRAASLRRNLRRMLDSVEAYARAVDCLGLVPGPARALVGNASDLPASAIPDSTIDAVVTSPRTPPCWTTSSTTRRRWPCWASTSRPCGSG